MRGDSKTYGKNTSEPAEESLLAIRTARSSRKDAIKVERFALNLGGIAEVLPFVPYGARGFLFCLNKTWLEYNVI